MRCGHTATDAARSRGVKEELPEPDPEIRRSQVTLKTVFTVSFGVLVVAAVVMALLHAVVAVALTGAALLIAVALNHVVHRLQRRRIKRPLAIGLVMIAVVGLLVGFGFTLIPPAVDQGKQLVKDAPGFIRTAR